MRRRRREFWREARRRRQPTDVNKGGAPRDEATEDENKSMCKKCTKEVLDGAKALGVRSVSTGATLSVKTIRKLFMTSWLVRNGEQLNWSCSSCHLGCNMLQKRIKKLEDKQLKMAEVQQQLELTTSKLVVNANDNKVKNEGLEARLGHLEAKSPLTNESVDKYKSITSDTVERLRVVETKLVTIESQQASSGTPTDHKKLHVTGCTQEPVYERKYRERNIILYGVQQSEAPEIECDLRLVCELMQECGIQSPRDKIFKVSRLCKPGENKNRPLLVKLKDWTTRTEMFRNVRNLHGKQKYENITLANDLMKQERDQEANPWKEAKTLTEAGQGGTEWWGLHGDGEFPG